MKRLPGGLSGWLLRLAATVLLGLNCLGPHPIPAAQPGIQDNCFLVEEAYNQNFGVVQHISSFTRFWNSKEWNYTFTQEWPVPGNERHQVSYTLAALHTGGLPRSGVGIGDVFLNYRYQLAGKGRYPRGLLSALQPDISHWRFYPGSRFGQLRGADQPSVKRCAQQETGQSLEYRRDLTLLVPRTPRAIVLQLPGTIWVRVLSGWSTRGSMSCWKPCLRTHRLWWRAITRHGQVHFSSVPASAGPTISRTAYRLCPDSASLWEPGRARAKKLSFSI